MDKKIERKMGITEEFSQVRSERYSPFEGTKIERWSDADYSVLGFFRGVPTMKRFI